MTVTLDNKHKLRRLSKRGRYVVFKDGPTRAVVLAQVTSRDAAGVHGRSHYARLKPGWRIGMIDMHNLVETTVPGLPSGPKPLPADYIPRRTFRQVLRDWFSKPPASPPGIPRRPADHPLNQPSCRWGDLFRPDEYRPVNAVGEASYMTQIMALVGRDVHAARAARFPSNELWQLSGTFAARLVRERGNRYDANAVAVVVTNAPDSWLQVGHLDRKDAAYVAQRLDTAGLGVIECAVRFVWPLRDTTSWRRLEVAETKIGVKLFP